MVSTMPSWRFIPLGTIWAICENSDTQPLSKNERPKVRCITLFVISIAAVKTCITMPETFYIGQRSKACNIDWLFTSNLYTSWGIGVVSRQDVLSGRQQMLPCSSPVGSECIHPWLYTYRVTSSIILSVLLMICTPYMRYLSIHPLMRSWLLSLALLLAFALLLSIALALCILLVRRLAIRSSESVELRMGSKSCDGKLWSPLIWNIKWIALLAPLQAVYRRRMASLFSTFHFESGRSHINTHLPLSRLRLSCYRCRSPCP